MISPHERPKLLLPIQARPVYRDAQDGSVSAHIPGGIEAAASRCASLPGMARQMCYAALYGITT